MRETASRWDGASSFGSGYTSPGWKRAQDRGASVTPPRYARSGVIEGEGRLIASADPAAGSGAYKRGDRVFHQKFGYGEVTAVEGAKLTVAFDKAGEKRVLESFVEKG